MQAREITVRIPIPPFSINGSLSLPEEPLGLAVLAQGSAASRPSPRDQRAIDELSEARIASARLDLLTWEEGEVDEDTHLLWSDVHLLAGRLVIATDFLAQHADTRGLALGYLGAGANASVALLAAATRSLFVRSIVSREGRPDLVTPALTNVVTPTLLIVASDDKDGLAANRRALEMITGPDKELRIAPRTLRHADERAPVDPVTSLTRDWFVRFLAPRDEPRQAGRAAAHLAAGSPGL